MWLVLPSLHLPLYTTKLPLYVAQNYSPLDGKTDEQIEEQARADLAQRAERAKRARPESDVPINDQIEYARQHFDSSSMLYQVGPIIELGCTIVHSLVCTGLAQMIACAQEGSC